MCLTIPKKVIEIKGAEIIVETISGDRQVLKSIIPLNIGDYVLSQQNVVIEKMAAEEAEDILKTFEEVRRQNDENK